VHKVNNKGKLQKLRLSFPFLAINGVIVNVEKIMGVTVKPENLAVFL
jgi:hypothetical protein